MRRALLMIFALPAPAQPHDIERNKMLAAVVILAASFQASGTGPTPIVADNEKAAHVEGWMVSFEKIKDCLCALAIGYRVEGLI